MSGDENGPDQETEESETDEEHTWRPSDRRPVDPDERPEDLYWARVQRLRQRWQLPW